MNTNFMDKETVAYKIYTLLHDPIIKALTFKLNINHEEIAKNIINELLKELNINLDEINDEIIKRADWIASSSDRCLISEIYEGKITEVYNVNILNLKGKNLSKLISKENIEKYKNNFVKTFKNIIKKYKNLPPHIFYHVFWRSLIPISVSSLDNNPDIALLPADTRIPYYTIYDHLYTSSGIVSSIKELKEYNKLGIIHWEFIGTQSFISQSRAFRDFWASSFLISLLNTALIIKLANKYGFDAIINPNMLFNPLVDLYLSSYSDLLAISLDKLKFPTTPDKCFAFVPYNKVEYYVNEIPKWLNDLWRKICFSIKHCVQKDLKYKDIFKESLEEYLKEKGKELKIDKAISVSQLINESYWDTIWEEISKESPIKLVCVGEEIDLTLNKIKEKLNSYPEIMFSIFGKKDEKNVKQRIINEISKIKEFIKTKTKYDINYQFFEFAIIIEYLKYKRKIVSEQPRINVERWILDNNIYVKNREIFCTICYIRPAVIFSNTNVRNVYPIIKEDERLCPVCLIKRLLATFISEDKKVNTDSPLVKILIEVFKWIDETKDGNRYVNALNKSLYEYSKKHETLLAKLMKFNIFTIPSLDTISTISFKLSLIRSNMYTEFNKKIIGIIEKIFGKLDYKFIFKDSPPLEWIEEKIEIEKGLFYLVSGELLVVEEIRRIAEGYKKEKEVENLLKELSELSKKYKEEIKNKIKSLKPNQTFVEEPSKYVALIRADGDNMGKLLSLTGKYQRNIKEVLFKEFNVRKDVDPELLNITYFATPSYYSSTSRILSTISMLIPKIANKYYTYVVYSGGDDILALSPVEMCIHFAYNSRKLFSHDYLTIKEENLNLKNLIDLKDKVELYHSGFTKEATQSFVIHIFHVFSPLKPHLNESIIEIDEIAKGDERKDSFVISYIARGGGKIYGKLPWYEEKIAEYLINSVSLTFRVPTKVEFCTLNEETIQANLIDNLSVSHRMYRDFLRHVQDKNYSRDVVQEIFNYELSRHLIKGSVNEYISIIPFDRLNFYIKIKDVERNLLIEFAKSSICLREGMASRPLILGERL